jgi:hypothetical protein
MVAMGGRRCIGRLGAALRDGYGFGRSGSAGLEFSKVTPRRAVALQ